MFSIKMVLGGFFFNGFYQGREFIGDAKFAYCVKLLGFIFGFFGHCEGFGTSLGPAEICERENQAKN